MACSLSPPFVCSLAFDVRKLVGIPEFIVNSMGSDETLCRRALDCFFSPWYLQRKRRGGTANSRQTQKRTREAASTPEIALEAEPIELVETGELVKWSRNAVTVGRLSWLMGSTFVELDGDQQRNLPAKEATTGSVRWSQAAASSLTSFIQNPVW